MSTSEAIIWIGASGTAMAAIWMLWKIVVAFIHAFNKIDALAKVIGPVTEMANDFKENGGSTLKDAVFRIDKAAAAAMDLSESNRADAVKLSAIVGDVIESNEQNTRLLYELRGHIAALPSVVTGAVSSSSAVKATTSALGSARRGRRKTDPQQ